MIPEWPRAWRARERRAPPRSWRDRLGEAAILLLAAALLVRALLTLF